MVMKMKHTNLGGAIWLTNSRDECMMLPLAKQDKAKVQTPPLWRNLVEEPHGFG